MRIENHRLVDAKPDGLRLEFIPDESAGPLRPRIAVIHYAVTETARATASVLNQREYCSCHVTVDKLGHVIQQVPFNRVAWHAGVSSYGGQDKVSLFSLGIEISNPGPLLLQPDGSLKTVYGVTWTGPVYSGRHSHPGAPRSWAHWAEYSQTELDVVAHICDLWKSEYGIVDVVGHDEIAPGRKFDPGPAFPMQWLRETVFPNLGKTEPPPP